MEETDDHINNNSNHHEGESPFVMNINDARIAYLALTDYALNTASPNNNK